MPPVRRGNVREKEHPERQAAAVEAHEVGAGCALGKKDLHQEPVSLPGEGDDRVVQVNLEPVVAQSLPDCFVPTRRR